MKTLLLSLLQLIYFVSCQFCQKDSLCSESSVLVQTKLGSFIGSSEVLNGVQLSVFKGIRFAQPPVGSLRFSDPVPTIDPWYEPKNVSSYGNTCPRSKVDTYDEDCLFLNIWSPSVGKGSKPVMVFVHGGSFNMGSGSEKSGAALASRGDVVVVTFNYRLGFFGYFYSDLSKNSGSNMGMKDQLLVLKWVQENIQFFGGDLNEVTLFGHSAGGISVGMHLLSPSSTPYFKRGIIESGTPFSFLRPDTLRVAEDKSLSLSKFLKCSSETDTSISEKALECLRTAKPEEILMHGSDQPMHSLILPNPVYGDDFFPKRADVAFQEQVTPLKDVIIGVEKNEGESFVRRKLGFLGSDYHVNLTYDVIQEFNHQLYDGKLTNEEQLLLFDYYFKNMENSPSEELKNQLFQAYGDLYVYCPSYFYAKYYDRQKSNEKIFMYLLNFKVTHPENHHCDGICHGEELPLVFGLPFLFPDSYTDRDRGLSDQIINYWSSFAKGQSQDLMKWTSFGQDNQIYNSLYESDTRQENEKFRNCDNFWKHVFEGRDMTQ